MASFRVSVGRAEYGSWRHRDGSISSTIFWHVNSFPLLPVAGHHQASLDDEGRSAPIFLPSLLLALFNAWGLVSLVALLILAHHNLRLTIASLGLMAVLFGSWFWGGGLWRAPKMRQRNLRVGAVLVVIAAVISTWRIVSIRNYLADVQSREKSLTPTMSLDDMAKLTDDAKSATEAGMRATAKSKCDAGDQASCVALGKLYEFGQDGPKDIPSAVPLYQRACDANESSGCARLGYLYRFASGVKYDPQAAIHWLTVACNAGNGWGCHHLGEMTSNGEGMPANKAAGAQLQQRACQLGEKFTCAK